MMTEESKISIIPFGELRKLFLPLHDKLSQLETKLDKTSSNQVKKYYRNKDLKLLFGISQNTIIKYRNNGNIPFTTIGDVYLYPVEEIDKVLSKNWVE
ncbi:helix-turn-helix domain-containing protein [Nonlabens ponticola]|uniref:DNA-binding protein n=1 Tax=Nonlabens ponticola TaxID=2496866 RepID=A0A3S9MZZ8_9FLAO|nr:helix-turn-helix domain-containing protein [Nonlabens ponticola]AZQ44855.1 DNA-binding protein [Nonlabens ponticola]